MNEDDGIEARLRETLHGSPASEHLDADAFLAQVHRGARRRRARRTAGGVAAAVLLVAGGGFAVQAAGVLGGNQTPVAASGHHPSRTFGTAAASHAPSSSAPPSVLPSTAPPTHQGTRNQIKPPPVSISAGSSLNLGEVKPMSLTATGTWYQWVLASTPGRDCEFTACATVLATDHHGTSWQTLGQLPAAPAANPTDTTDPTTVGQLRFTKDPATGGHDGWAFGGALWSTHDGGHTWTQETPHNGRVTDLAAWGNQVFAAVASASGQSRAWLIRSPAAVDAWHRIAVPHRMASIDDLAVASNGIGVIDERPSSSGTSLLVSADGVNWSSQQPCRGGLRPEALSTAASSLWVVCADGNEAALIVTTDHGVSWGRVPGTLPADVTVAARDDTDAVVASPASRQLSLISVEGRQTSLGRLPVADVDFAGFTNPQTGYLMSAEGRIVRTDTGGKTWRPYVVR